MFSLHYVLMFTICFKGTIQSELCSNTTGHEKCYLLPKDSSCGHSFERQSLEERQAHYGEFPWIVYFRGGDVSHKTNCAGSVISKRYIVMSASCCPKTMSQSGGDFITLAYHEKELCKKNPTADECQYTHTHTYFIEEYKIHEQYDEARLINNICLIRLKSDILYARLVPICLPFENEYFPQNNQVQLAGWELADDRKHSRLGALHTITGLEVPQHTCNKLFNGENVPVTRDDICVTTSGRRQFCKEYFGGPLMKLDQSREPNRYVLYGINSHLPKECVKHSFSLYVRVSHYVTWILDNMRL